MKLDPVIIRRRKHHRYKQKKQTTVLVYRWVFTGTISKRSSKSPEAFSKYSPAQSENVGNEVE